MAAVLTPFYRRLLGKGLGKNLAALVTVLLALFVLILPLAWILWTGAKEALLLYGQISENPALLRDLLGRLHAAFPQAQVPCPHQTDCRPFRRPGRKKDPS